MTEFNKLSRRQMLSVAAGATVAGALGATTPAKAAKAPQAAVKYQAEPKDGKKCDDCVLFQAPSSCKNVDGEISPNGWCMIWAKKPS